MQIFLLLTLLICTTYSQSECDNIYDATSCSGQTPTDAAPCGCEYIGTGDFPCATIECPPATTSTTLVTQCFCPTTAPQTTARRRLLHGKSKGSGTSGLGVGNCDVCDGKLAEIRYVYQGSQVASTIEIFIKDTSSLICSYSNVQPNDEIICNLRGDAPGLVGSASQFENETPFVITRADGSTCSAQYHTSCSQDIVGVVQPECTELIVSGWRDNDNYDAGFDCDDGFEPCTCDDGTVTTEPEPTGTEPCWLGPQIGEQCYCHTSGGSGTTSSTTTVPPSKAGKSGKTSSKNGEGLGVGDCDCDGGQADLTVMYQGSDTDVGIKCQNRKEGDADLPVSVSSVTTGDEFTCSKGTFEKLGTETLITLYNVNTNEEICNTQIHTSCSRDIVGTSGASSGSGTFCDADLIVTGWRDNNNFDPTDPTYNLRCDDGFEKCSCDEDCVFVEEPADPLTETHIEIVPGVCICSDQSPAVLQARFDAYQAAQGTTRRLLHKSKSKSKSKNRDNGFGYGDCDCSGGMYAMRFFYKGDGPVTIQLYNKDNGPLVCELEDVNQGDENYCSLKEFPLDSNNDPQFEKFTTDTYFQVTDASGTVLCSKDTAKLHTSCSKDIIGWTPEGCEDIIVSGWNDNSNNECDDGFYPCPCDVPNCAPFTPNEGQYGPEEGDACEEQDGCEYDSTTQTCLSVLTNDGYMKRVVFGMMGVIFGFIALF